MKCSHSSKLNAMWNELNELPEKNFMNYKRAKYNERIIELISYSSDKRLG